MLIINCHVHLGEDNLWACFYLAVHVLLNLRMGTYRGR